MEVESPSTSPHFPDSFYRVAVKGLCVRDGKVLLSYDTTCIRSNGEKFSAWELPGGGMEFGETFEEALRREVKEEMGVEVSWIADSPLYSWTCKKTRSRGLDWYYSLLLAFPFEVKSLDITPTDECREARFFSREELRAAVLNEQLELFREMFDPAHFESGKIMLRNENGK